MIRYFYDDKPRHQYEYDPYELLEVNEFEKDLEIISIWDSKKS